MKNKRIYSIILTIALIVAFAPSAKAHDFEVDGIYYNITSSTDNTVAVTYKGYSYSSYENEYTGDVVIPTQVSYSGTTYSVSSIGDSAFCVCSGLTSVTIPDSVSSIGDSAFRGCSGLTSVTIPDSVSEIGDSAFRGCSGLTSVTIPDSVSEIGTQAFYYCSGLTSVTIPDSVTEIGEYAFAYCTGLTSITIPDSVTKIGTGAFCGCSDLTSVTIPNSVSSIGDSAFRGCSSLTSVTIPNAVTSIGSEAFYGCSGLTSVTIPNAVTSIGSEAFYGCSGLTSVTIPNSVTSIGEYAFYDCSGLTSVNISDLMAWCNIDFSYLSNPLSYAHNLYLNEKLVTDLVLPNSITKIKDFTFSGCSGLTSVTIPNSVTEIGSSSFRDCNGLTSVTIPNSVTSIGNKAFYGCSGLTSVIIPDSVTSIGEYAFAYCSGLTSVTIPDSVTSIGEYAFYNCTGLTSATIPNSVTEIGSCAFRGCSGLTSVTIPDSVTEIGTQAFYYCSGLTSVTIPDSVTEIGYYAFSGCTGLTAVNIPNSVTKIGYYAFEGCDKIKFVQYDAKNAAIGSYTEISSVKHIVFGETVETISSGFFNDSSNAISIVSKNPTPPICDTNTFQYIDKTNCILYVPTASVVDYWTADVWKDFANIRPLNEVTSLSLNEGECKIATFETLQLNATIAPADASVTDVLWTSSNPNIATISATGEVYGVAPGEVTITAMTVDGSNLQATCKVKVEVVKAQSISLSQSSATLEPYQSVTLTYTILPEHTYNKSVTWTSSDPSIAVVKVNNDNSASVLMLQKGSAIITATTNDGSNLSASCYVADSAGVDAIATDACSIAVENGAIVVKNGVGTVTVYNTMGVAAATAEADGNDVRIDGLQQGVYIITLGDKAVKVMI